jgi:hypothetical protein
METISNEEKAIELAENISPYDIGGDNAAHYAAKDAALDAMQWKDEQHEQEKQQLIDKAADFISKHFYIGINNHITSNENYFSLTELIRDFTNSIKEP